MRFAGWLLGCCAGLASAGAVHADEPTWLLFGGAQASSENSYLYAGGIEPMWGGGVGQGWFGKVVASWLRYRYDTVQGGAPVEVRASAPGIEVGVGQAWRAGALSADASLSVGVRRTQLRPDVPSDTPTGTRFTLTPQVAARYDFTSLVNADTLASYSFGTRALFWHTRVGLDPAAHWRTGIEGVLSSGPDYRSVQRGVFVGTRAGEGGWVEMNAGRARARDGKQSSYIGISASKLL